MTLEADSRLESTFVGVEDGTPIYATRCDDVIVDRRFVSKQIGVEDGTPIYAFANCNTLDTGRYLARFVGVEDGTPIYAISCCVGCCWSASDVYSQVEWIYPLNASSPIGSGSFALQEGETCCYLGKIIEDWPLERVCSDVVWSQDSAVEYDINCYVYELPRYDQSSEEGAPAPIVNCNITPTLCGTTHVEYSRSRAYYLVAEFQITEIGVWLFKAMIDCGSGAECKWIVAAVCKTEIQWGYALASGQSMSRTSVGVGTCCVEGPDISSSTTPTACEDQTGISIGATSGLGFFARYRVFDTKPTGDITFTDADKTLPSGCSGTHCLTGTGVLEQFEVTSSVFSPTEDVESYVASTNVEQCCYYFVTYVDIAGQPCQLLEDCTKDLDYTTETVEGFAGDYWCCSASTLLPFPAGAASEVGWDASCYSTCLVGFGSYTPGSTYFTFKTVSAGCQIANLNFTTTLVPYTERTIVWSPPSFTLRLTA